MYCTFTTCMYVYMLMYMSAYICVCMHVYVIYGSEGLRKMWDFKQTQKQNSDLKMTVTKHISKGRRGTLTTESWRRSSRLSRSGYSFRANCCTSAAWAPHGWLCRFRKTVWGRHKVRSQREISPQLIKKKKKLVKASTRESETQHPAEHNERRAPLFFWSHVGRHKTWVGLSCAVLSQRTAPRCFHGALLEDFASNAPTIRMEWGKTRHHNFIFPFRVFVFLGLFSFAVVSCGDKHNS